MKKYLVAFDVTLKQTNPPHEMSQTMSQYISTDQPITEVFLEAFCQSKREFILGSRAKFTSNEVNCIVSPVAVTKMDE